MGFVDVIAKKRDGGALSREDIDQFVAGVTDGRIPDYQASALLMAIVLRGMSAEETAALTDAMVRSGERVDLSDIPGIKVGKHSTGGVGDKISIVLAPLAAACGVVVPKMSGRGLGHTGGTLDKLESIPGYRTDLTVDEFKAVLRRIGASIIGQSATLAPADKHLYALRDVTATVSSVPLIAASVMSKKLAEGADALVLDVKCGQGAFMKTREEATALARMMVAIGTRAGVRTEAVVSSMDAPLGRAIGNALEVIECLEVLQGRGPDDVRELAVALAARMVVLATGKAERDAEAAVRGALASGGALETLKRMVTAHGGDARALTEHDRLPSASQRTPVAADRDGYVESLQADLLGRASMALGAGRQRKDDPIDHGAGIRIVRKQGDKVRAGETVIELHYNATPGVGDAEAMARRAIRVGASPPPQHPLILSRVVDGI